MIEINNIIQCTFCREPALPEARFYGHHLCKHCGSFVRCAFDRAKSIDTDLAILPPIRLADAIIAVRKRELQIDS